jgi:hypothetical protein
VVVGIILGDSGDDGDVVALGADIMRGGDHGNVNVWRGQCSVNESGPYRTHHACVQPGTEE